MFSIRAINPLFTLVIYTNINSESGTEVPAGHKDFGRIFWYRLLYLKPVPRVSSTFWTSLHCQVKLDFVVITAQE